MKGPPRSTAWSSPGVFWKSKNRMGLHIIVCIKSVIVEAPNQSMVRSSDSSELNPFDRPALEQAIRMKETVGGEVTALTMGPASCAFVLQEAMAVGVDKGVLVSDIALAGSDTLATSTTLAAAIKRLEPFDLVLFGTRTSDSDTGHVGPQTAVLLDLPLVTWARTVQTQENGLIVERSIDGFRERFELPFPAMLTIHPTSVQPRDLGLSGIMDAFEEGEIQKWDLTDLGLSASMVGEEGSPTRLLSMSKVNRTKKCEFLNGTAEEQAEGLLGRLLDTGLIG
jgi:electron transfer flavoprotein beta subunit